MTGIGAWLPAVIAVTLLAGSSLASASIQTTKILTPPFKGSIYSDSGFSTTGNCSVASRSGSVSPFSAAERAYDNSTTTNCANLGNYTDSVATDQVASGIRFLTTTGVHNVTISATIHWKAKWNFTAPQCTRTSPPWQPNYYCAASESWYIVASTNLTHANLTRHSGSIPILWSTYAFNPFSFVREEIDFSHSCDRNGCSNRTTVYPKPSYRWLTAWNGGLTINWTLEAKLFAGQAYFMTMAFYPTSLTYERAFWSSNGHMAGGSSFAKLVLSVKVNSLTIQ